VIWVAKSAGLAEFRDDERNIPETRVNHVLGYQKRSRVSTFCASIRQCSLPWRAIRIALCSGVTVLMSTLMKSA